MISRRIEVIDGCNELISSITDFTEEISELEGLTDENDIIESVMEKLIRENARLSMDQNEYIRKYGHMAGNLSRIEEIIVEFKESIESKRMQRSLIGDYMDILKQQEELLESFDNDIWISTVDHVKVKSDNGLVKDEGDRNLVLQAIHLFT